MASGLILLLFGIFLLTRTVTRDGVRSPKYPKGRNLVDIITNL